MKKQKPDFNTFYAKIWGNRWPPLKQALLLKPYYVQIMNGLLKPYYLDEASLIAAHTLEIEPHDTIIDMCAAPGGKTLVLSTKMGPTNTLVSNDRSAGRRDRLKKVIKNHIPLSLQKRIHVTGHDATKWGLFSPHSADKILLDIPCSSERHILSKNTALRNWSPARTKHLAVQAYAFLSAAFMAIKCNGKILYCTCTISPKENDEVISKLKKRHRDHVRIIPVRKEIGEPTEHGRHILPDTTKGRGPIYFCYLQKTK